MRIFTALNKLSKAYRTLHSYNCNVLNYMPCRNFARDVKIKWVRPTAVHSYDPSQSGDLTPFQMPTDDKMKEYFDSCELIHKTNNENVKKIFSFGNQSLRDRYFAYKMSLINKVKAHELDDSSLEVQIAKSTSSIRIMQHIMHIKRQGKRYGMPLNMLIHKRRRQLKSLREADYKKFEWLLEQLDLKFYPDPIKKERIIRKNATKLLAELRKEKLKEMKIAEIKRKLDQKKVPFLEKKLKILKQIMEKESAFQLEQTVTDADIDNCIKEIEKVKIQVEENQKRGYVKKVHPYTLEVYHPQSVQLPNTN